MKTKIIPFNLELAKKIQAGEIEGAIKMSNGRPVRLLCANLKNEQCIVAAYANKEGLENLYTFGASGNFLSSCKRCDYDLVLEVPDTEQDKPQFKLFDKVLVRGNFNKNYKDSCWYPALFERIIESSFGEDKGTIYYKVLTNVELWRECIPYEGNQELVGTTDKPKEE